MFLSSSFPISLFRIWRTTQISFQPVLAKVSAKDSGGRSSPWLPLGKQTLNICYLCRISYRCLLLSSPFSLSWTQAPPLLSVCSLDCLSVFVFSYGDRFPCSVPARIFGIAWTLTGIVIISILTSAIASALTIVNVPYPIKLYGAKVRFDCKYIISFLIHAAQQATWHYFILLY